MTEKEKEAKFQRIIDRIIADNNQKDWDIIFAKDNKLKKLRGDRALAMQQQMFLKMRLITNMIEAREKEIQNGLAQEVLPHLVRNGRIVPFLDKEDQVEYQEKRVRIFMLYDAIDSAFHDLNSMNFNLGISTSLKMTKAITEARDSIKEWNARNTTFSVYGLDDIVYDEADRINDYVMKRVPFLIRKIDRFLDKKEKEEKQEKDKDKE